MLPNDNVSMSVGHLDHVLTEGRKKNTLLKHSMSVATLPGPSTGPNTQTGIVEKSLKDGAKKTKNTRDKHKGMVVVPYVKGLSEAFARILKSHGIATANRSHRILRNFVVHPKDKVKDEEKTDLIYRVPCKNCSSSYI